MKGRIWIWNILALICLTACDRWFDVNPQTEVKQKELFSTDQVLLHGKQPIFRVL